MATPRDDEIKNQLQSLIKAGLKLQEKFTKKESPSSMALDYQNFYTVSASLIKQILPERYVEYTSLYSDSKAKQLNWSTYTISDFLNHTVVSQYGNKAFDQHDAASTKFLRQLTILASARDSLGSLLKDLRTIIVADLFDTEVETCRALAAAKHYRAAGALSGVLLEKHLGNVTQQRSLSIAKKNPTIADFNEAMKNAGVIDLVQWRGIQRLADIRNLASHAKGREPTPDEINELIDGVDRIMKTLL